MHNSACENLTVKSNAVRKVDQNPEVIPVSSQDVLDKSKKVLLKPLAYLVFSERRDQNRRKYDWPFAALEMHDVNHRVLEVFLCVLSVASPSFASGGFWQANL